MWLAVVTTSSTTDALLVPLLDTLTESNARSARCGISAWPETVNWNGSFLGMISINVEMSRARRSAERLWSTKALGGYKEGYRYDK